MEGGASAAGVDAAVLADVDRAAGVAGAAAAEASAEAAFRAAILIPPSSFGFSNEFLR